MKGSGIVLEPRAVLRSYTFFVAAFMFGLPLLISYYAVQEGIGAARFFVAAYVASSLILGFAILIRFGRPGPAAPVLPERRDARRVQAGWPPLVALSSGTLAVASFGLMKYLIALSYPAPSPQAGLAGGVYVVALGAAAAAGFPVLAEAAFPFLKGALADRRLRASAILIGAVYFVTYEILVNEILVTGYNAPPGNIIAPPSASYPWVHVFTSGPNPAQAIETVIYTPYVLVQVNQYVNFVFQPFELALAVAISVLVASAVVATYHLVKRNEKMGGACSVSATLSGVGAFLGYTATCPSCLAPTLVSVVFGGLATVQTVYSNLWGAVVPPVVSVIALTVSLYIIGRGYRALPASASGLRSA